jgi:hypothetical protein
MRRIGVLCVIVAALALPAAASATGNCAGAERAAEHTRAFAYNESGLFHCHSNSATHFDVTFVSGPGSGPSWSVTVFYANGRYHVGIPRFA